MEPHAYIPVDLLLINIITNPAVRFSSTVDDGLPFSLSLTAYCMYVSGIVNFFFHSSICTVRSNRIGVLFGQDISLIRPSAKIHHPGLL